MRALAGYIMQGRLQAALIVVAFAAASLLITPLSYVSGAAVGLVTLVNGVGFALGVIGIAAAVTIGIGLVTAGGPVIGLAFLMAIWLPMVLVSEVLRRTVSMPLALLAAAALGVLLVLGLHATVADPSAWWTSHLEQLLAQFQAQGAEMDGATREVLGRLAELLTGVLGAALAMSLALTLFIARWWQALLYNPGGFREEFHGLRQDPRLVWVAMALFIGALLTPEGVAPVALHLLMVVAILYLIQGVAVVHGSVARLQLHGLLLWVFYILMLLVPHVVLATGALGFLDRWLDVRARIPDRRPGDDDSV